MSLVDRFIDWAYQGLLQSDDAQAYLHSRGVSSYQWERHRLGYVIGDYFADASKDLDHNEDCSDWEKKSARCDTCRLNRWSSSWDETDEDGRRIQLIGRKIVGSIVLPLTNYAGQAVGFQVRSLTEKSYDTFVMKKHPEGYFFGIGPNMETIWRTSEVWLVEGPLDALVFERLAFPNVVALATNAVSPLQATFLRRFVRRVNLLLDGDAAGRKGVASFMKQHGTFFDVRDIRCPAVGPKDKDPGDLWKSVGDAGFKKRLANVIPEMLNV